MTTPTIYNRWSDSAPFDRLLFRPDRILQSAEVKQFIADKYKGAVVPAF